LNCLAHLLSLTVKLKDKLVTSILIVQVIGSNIQAFYFYTSMSSKLIDVIKAANQKPEHEQPES